MQKSRRLSRENGFTLVELMIVVLIIAVLIGIAVVSFTVSISASKKAACRANLKIIHDELVVYYTVHGDDPATLNDLIPDYIENGDSLRCPESGEDYIFDPVTGEVSCPYHTDL